MASHNILIVEDEPLVARDIVSVLDPLGYRLLGPAVSGEEAIEHARAEAPDLIVMDVDLGSGMDGIEAAESIRSHADIPVVFVTGSCEQVRRRIEQARPSACLVKPFQPNELRTSIEAVLQAEARLGVLRVRNEQLLRGLRTTIETMASLIELRNPFIVNHPARVADLSVAIGQAIGLDADRLEGLRLGALIHDIGVVRLPFELLSQQRPWDAAERALYDSHSQFGYEVLSRIRCPWPLAEIVRQHHERWDGSGVPQGLSGQAILLEARIVAVADAVDKAVSGRPQRPAVPLDQALRDIEAEAETGFDPDVVDACVRLFTSGGFRFD